MKILRKIPTYLETRIIIIAVLCIQCRLVELRNITKCYNKSPFNGSKNICGDLCNEMALCSMESGACLCDKEPTPTSLGGHFTHCTNWNYVEQTECHGMCLTENKNDSRVCWTFFVGNYCTCFN